MQLPATPLPAQSPPPRGAAAAPPSLAAGLLLSATLALSAPAAFGADLAGVRRGQPDPMPSSRSPNPMNAPTRRPRWCSISALPTY
ncbi:hypothetical protein ACU4GD_44870 [Cupriavidus basilensis]